MYSGEKKMSTLNIVFLLWFMGMEVNILCVLKKLFFIDDLLVFDLCCQQGINTYSSTS